jgi:hypothetical protein
MRAAPALPRGRARVRLPSARPPRARRTCAGRRRRGALGPADALASLPRRALARTLHGRRLRPPLNSVASPSSVTCTGVT